MRPEQAGLIPVSLLLKESLIRGLWNRPTFLPIKKTKSPDEGRDREGGKTRFRITAPPWSSDSTWPCPMQTLRGHRGGKCSLFMSAWTLRHRQDTRTFLTLLLLTDAPVLPKD